MKTLPLGLAAAVLSIGVAAAQQSTTPSNTTAPPGSPPATTPPATTTPAQPSAAGRPGLNPGNTNSGTPPAVTTSQSNTKTAAAPVRGRNSFSAAQARRRIEACGFTQVTDLRKDREGIWRGKGMKDGQSVAVYCDYQGNVGAQ